MAVIINCFFTHQRIQGQENIVFPDERVKMSFACPYHTANTVSISILQNTLQWSSCNAHNIWPSKASDIQNHLLKKPLYYHILKLLTSKIKEKCQRVTRVLRHRNKGTCVWHTNIKVTELIQLQTWKLKPSLFFIHIIRIFFKLKTNAFQLQRWKET